MSQAPRLVLCALLIVGCQPEDRHLFFADAPYPVTMPQSAELPTVEFVREYGGYDRSPIFGHISDLAVSETGVLAVVDVLECRIWFIYIHTGLVDTQGECGDGPAEFRRPSTAVFVADTLLVFDADRGTVTKMTMDGEEVARLNVTLSGLDAVSLSYLSPGADGSILAALDLLPNQARSQHRQLAAFDPADLTVVGSGLVSPRIANTTPRPVPGHVSLCVSSKPEGTVLGVAVNLWGPQVVTLDLSDFSVLSSVRVPIDWVQPSEHSQMPGHWGPFTPFPRAACGERFAVITYRLAERDPDGSSSVRSAAMVLLDLRDGTVNIVAIDQAPEDGSILWMIPGVATGDRFFFFTNASFGHPTIREYRIVPGGNDT